MPREKAVPQLRLTASGLEALAARLVRNPAVPQRVVMRDRVVPALLVRASGSTISFVVVGRVRLRQRTGPVRRITLGRWPATTIDTARREAVKAAEKLSGGTDPVEEERQMELARLGKLTVRRLSELWLASPEASGWRPRTRYEFERLLRVELLPLLGGRIATELHRADLAAALDRIVVGRVMKPKPDGQLVPANPPRVTLAKRARAVLGRLLRWAVERGYLEAVPSLPPVSGREKPRERVLDDDEIRKLWNAALWGDPLDRAVQFALLTGLRRGELLSARREDLHTEDGRPWLVLKGERRKVARIHRVPLSPQARAALGEPGESWLFPSRSGGQRHADQRGIQKLFREAGILDASIHDVRRTVLSRIAAKFGLEAAAHVGGHALPGVTRRHYAAGPGIHDAAKIRALVWWGRQVARIVGRQ